MTGFFYEAGLVFPRHMDLSAVRIHDGVPEVVKKFAVISVGGVVVGNHIFANDISEFRGRNWSEIELIAHELSHVQQYGQLKQVTGSTVIGTVAYGVTYLGGFLGGVILGKDGKTAYEEHPYEKAAKERAARIVSELQARGEKPCP